MWIIEIFTKRSRSPGSSDMEKSEPPELLRPFSGAGKNSQIASNYIGKTAKPRNCCKKKLGVLSFFILCSVCFRSCVFFFDCFFFFFFFFRFCFRFLSCFFFVFWSNLTKTKKCKKLRFSVFFFDLCLFFSFFHFFEIIFEPKNIFNLFSNPENNFRFIFEPEAHFDFVFAITGAIATVIFATLAGFVATT